MYFLYVSSLHSSFAFCYYSGVNINAWKSYMDKHLRGSDTDTENNQYGDEGRISLHIFFKFWMPKVQGKSRAYVVRKAGHTSFSAWFRWKVEISITKFRIASKQESIVIFRRNFSTPAYVFWNSPLYQVIFVIFESWVVNVSTTSKNQLLSLHFCWKCGDHLVRSCFVRVQVCDMYPDWNFAGERFFSGFCCCRICLPTELLNWFFSIIYFF